MPRIVSGRFVQPFALLWVFGACLALLFPGCGSNEAGYAYTYTVRAQVVQLPDGSPSGQFLAHHETIPDYQSVSGSVGMQQMVMPFTVVDPEVLEGLAVGDIVEITYGESHRPRVRQGVIAVRRLPDDTVLDLGGEDGPGKP